MLGEGLLKGIVGIVGSPWLKSPAQGAATSITAALDPALDNQSGKPCACTGCPFTLHKQDCICSLHTTLKWKPHGQPLCRQNN